MQQHSSKRNAPAVERPKVAPIWLILLLAGLVGSALWVLYPRDDLEQRLQATELLLQPVKEVLENFRERLVEAEKQRADKQKATEAKKAKTLRKPVAKQKK